MVELIGVAGADQTDVIDDLGKIRQGFGDFHARLTVAGELELRSHDGGIGADEREPLAFRDRSRERLAVHLGEVRLEIEEIEMARCACHEEMDDGLGLAREVARMWRHGVDESRSGLRTHSFCEQSRESHFSDANAAVAKEVTAGDIKTTMLKRVHAGDQLLVTNSSMFIKARATAVQAARGRMVSAGPFPARALADSGAAVKRCCCL